MLAAFARSAHDMLAPTYGATSFHGVGGVFLLGVGAIVIGVVAMLIVRTRFPGFFRGGREMADPHPAAPARATHVTVTDLTDTEA
jgi:hypothetical protein